MHKVSAVYDNASGLQVRLCANDDVMMMHVRTCSMVQARKSSAIYEEASPLVGRRVCVRCLLLINVQVGGRVCDDGMHDHC